MQVQRIQNNNNYQPQFKGKLKKSVSEYFTKRIEQECSSYVKSLASDTLKDKNELIKIKTKWNDILNMLQKKVACMHKDTSISVLTKQVSSTEDVGTIEYMQIENSKLGLNYCLKILYCNSPNESEQKENISADSLKQFVQDLQPIEIDCYFLEAKRSGITAACKGGNFKDFEASLINAIDFQRECFLMPRLLKTMNNCSREIKSCIR